MDLVEKEVWSQYLNTIWIDSGCSDLETKIIMESFQPSFIGENEKEIENEVKTKKTKRSQVPVCNSLTLSVK